RPAAPRRGGLDGGELGRADVRLGLGAAAAEPRLGGEVDDRADLLPELRRHVAVDDLDALGDAGIDRVGERHAGLVGDGLAVDDVLALAVRSLEVEAAVLVFGEAGGGGDDLLHGARGDRRGRLGDVGLVDVDVALAGVGLQLR